jgi:hypothetical protein
MDGEELCEGCGFEECDCPDLPYGDDELIGPEPEEGD